MRKLIAIANSAGGMSAGDKDKLDNVQPGATANASDAALRNRSTHTGTQASSTIADFDSAVDARIAETGAKGSLVRVATTADIDLSAAPATIDGIAMAEGNRVLARLESTAAENGIYIYPAEAGQAMVRASDADTMDKLKGAEYRVVEGSQNAGKLFYQETVSGIVGSADIVFREEASDKAELNAAVAAALAAQLWTIAAARSSDFNVADADLRTFIPCDASGGSMLATFNAGLSIPVGGELIITKDDASANTVRLRAGAGATLNALGGQLTLEEQHAQARVIYRGGDVYEVSGDLALTASGFPQVAGTSTGSLGNAATHTVDLPAGVAAGELLVAILTTTQAPDPLPAPAGWTPLVSGDGNVAMSIMMRVADGTEGATVDFASPSNDRLTYVVYRIADHNGVSGVESAVTASPGGNEDAQPDPPSLAPSWGAGETLWIAAASIQRGLRASPDLPDDFGGVVHMPSGNNGTGYSTTTACHRELNAASEDPSFFDFSGDGHADSNGWHAALIAVQASA